MENEANRVGDTDYSVSVVIPAYNSGKYIARAIQSVLNQTLPVDEIIVVDDGSTDNTADEVGKFGDKVKYIYQENAGASAARNAGILAAKSEWIAFLDADDEWLPDKQQLQIDLLKRNPDLVWCTGNFEEIKSEDSKKMLFYSADLVQKNVGDLDKINMFDSFRVWGWTGTVIVKKVSLIESGLFSLEQKRFNDIDMWFRVGFRWPEVGYVKTALGVYHRIDGPSITRVHQKPDYLINTLNKNLVISKEYDKYDDFSKCVTGILRSRIHECMFDERLRYNRKLVTEFKDYLPKYYVHCVYLLTIWPSFTLKLMPMLRLINKFIKIPV